MPATGRFFVTPHAIERYTERIEPGLSYEESLGRMIRDLDGAKKVRDLAPRDGVRCELWRGPRPRRTRYVIGYAEGGLPQVVTVPPHATLITCRCGERFERRRKDQETCGSPECRDAALPRFECPICGTAVPRRRKAQRTCGAPACRDKMRWRRLVADPERAAARVEQNRRAHRRRVGGVANPWLLGPVPYGPAELPGGILRIEPHPVPSWWRTWPAARVIHGILTDLLGEDHDPNVPAWSLMPYGEGWAAWFAEEEAARGLANGTHRARLADRYGTVRFGPLMRPKAPRVHKGRHRIELTALSPVSIRRNGSESEYHVLPTADCLESTLRQHLASRLGVGVEAEDLAVELVERRTKGERVHLGGKYPPVGGWSGTLSLDVNAPALWLLLAAARGPGLGGRTALGMGRVDVRG